MKKSELKNIVKEEIKSILKEDAKKDYAEYASKKKALISAFKEYRRQLVRVGDPYLGELEDIYDTLIDLDDQVNDLIKIYGFRNK